MGGIGSGRYPRMGSRSRYFVADQQVLRLDIRELHRDGFLHGEGRGAITWFRYGAEVAGIGTRFDPCMLAIRLSYTAGDPAVAVSDVVKLTYTACYFGGDRPWFLCPACSRRCAVLWGRGRFLCRHCQRVAYASQNESAASRSIRRIHEIRARLGVDPSVSLGRIVRPRYMRYDRYLLLLLELVQHEAARSIYIHGLRVAWEGAEDDFGELQEALRAA